MDRTDEVLLRLLCAALQGEKPADPEFTPEQWGRLLRLAEAHKLLPLVLDLSVSLPSCRDALAAQASEPGPRWKDLAFEQVSRQAFQENEFLDLILALRERGLRPLVLKGPLCRALYPKPLLRPSVDDDLLIDAAQARAYHAALLELGMTADAPDADPETEWELSYHKPGSPLYLELHKRLFDPEQPAVADFNQLFEGAADRAVPVRVQDVDLLSPAPQDHLLFLLLHAFKHFLFSGFGLRILSDVCLFSRHWAGEIDFDAIARSCERLHCAKFAAALYQIGASELGIPAPEPFAGTEVALTPLLEDILAAGLLGAEIERLHSANITVGAAAMARTGGRSSALRSALFPPASAIRDDYPYLDARPWLLPAAWTSRIWRYLTRRGAHTDGSAAAALRIGRERVRLLEFYDIIDRK